MGKERHRLNAERERQRYNREYKLEAVRLPELGQKPAAQLASMPPRLKSLIEGEPHFGIRGLTILPFRIQGFVARRLFNKRYPYPIVRQYTSARSLLRVFAAQRLVGIPVLIGRIGSKIRRFPRCYRLAAEYFWDLVVITKPMGAGDRAPDHSLRH